SVCHVARSQEEIRTAIVGEGYRELESSATVAVRRPSLCDPDSRAVDDSLFKRDRFPAIRRYAGVSAYVVADDDLPVRRREVALERVCSAVLPVTKAIRERNLASIPLEHSGPLVPARIPLREARARAGAQRQQCKCR